MYAYEVKEKILNNIGKVFTKDEAVTILLELMGDITCATKEGITKCEFALLDEALGRFEDYLVEQKIMGRMEIVALHEVF